MKSQYFLKTLKWHSHILHANLLGVSEKLNTKKSSKLNSLGPSDTIWWQRYGSPLVQVMGCAWWHQAITWTNVDLSSVRSSDIHLRASSQEIPQPSITKINWKIKYLKCHSNFSGVNELRILNVKAQQYQPFTLWSELSRRPSSTWFIINGIYFVVIFSWLFSVNSSPPMCQWSRSSLVQVMACPLLGAKPLPGPVLVYCQLDCWEEVSVKFESEFYHFHSRKCIWRCQLPKWRPFCPGGDESIPQHKENLIWVRSWNCSCLVTWFCYQLKHFPHHWHFVQGIHCPLVNSPHKGQWCGALIFSLIYAWTNSWINNWDAGDLRHHCAHYDVIIMFPSLAYFQIFQHLPKHCLPIGYHSWAAATHDKYEPSSQNQTDTKLKISHRIN